MGRERGAGGTPGADEPFDLAASSLDEEPPFVSSTPDTPSIAEPGGASDTAELRRADERGKETRTQMTRSTFRLTSTQARTDPAGHLVMNGPVDGLNAAVLTSRDEKLDIRAATAAEAVVACQDAGLPFADARLETHSFEDPVTNDVRDVAVWVPVAPL